MAFVQVNEISSKTIADYANTVEIVWNHTAEEGGIYFYSFFHSQKKRDENFVHSRKVDKVRQVPRESFVK
jgi:hypothetical protein